MAKKFGQTWWGQQWLNSLSNIDYSNRLPRGSAYANKGAVTSISINENQIVAKVKGSRPKPYDVTIIIPPFFEPEIKKLISALAKKPAIISKLLNRELDPEILNIAEQQGLKVFPRQWTDFKMQCSCPDWAVPCKHLAAVIYKISAEIDNNPFLVFSLHKVNLIEELKKENIFIQKENLKIPSIREILLSSEEKLSGKKKQNKAAVNDLNFRDLNFSNLSPIHESLIQLVEDKPVFYQQSGNFRDKYAVGIRKAVRNMQRLMTGKAVLEDFFSIKSSKPLNHHTDVTLFIDEQNKVTIKASEKISFSPSEMIKELWEIPVSHANDYQISVATLRYALLFACNLVATGSVVPQIVQLDNRKFAVRWLPAMLSKEVRQLVEKFESFMPGVLLFFQGKNKTAIGEGQATHLLSIFLNEWMSRLTEISPDDIYLNLFFNNQPYPFNKPGESALPGRVSQWLQRYYLTQGKYKSSIVVEELLMNEFQLNLTVKKNDKSLSKPAYLKDVLNLKKYDQERFEILQSVANLSSFVPGLDEYINSKGKEEIILDTKSFAPFLMQAIPAIQLLDIDILLPKSLQQILRPKPSIKVKSKAKDGKGFLRLEKLLDFDWQVSIGDTLMDEEEFRKLLKHSDGLIRFKTNYIYVNPEELQKLYKHFSSAKTLSSFEMLRAVLSGEYQGAKIALTNEVKALIRQLTEQDIVALPQGLNASLRPYQHRGFSWMYRNSQIGFGSIIADDMGLGKTLQVIATILKYKEDGFLQKEKALVVAPTGLITNWQAEIEKFAPSLRCNVYHGATRQLEDKTDFDVLLTTYGMVRSDADKLKKMKWQVVVTDEAQNIKNHDTAQSKAVKSIPANTFIAMSGTPVENRLSELWSIADFSNRGFLGSVKDFKEDFAVPIQNQNDLKAAEKLKKITAPFLMRRLKSDKTIITDLPDKIEMDAYSQLTKEQAGLYEKTLEKAMQAIEGIEGKDHKALFVRQGLVLQMMLALKQICNHPTQFLKNNVLDASLSGKMELLFDRLENIVDNNEKVLIFTQFTEMGELLKHFIAERFGETPLYYHGGCSIKQRKEMVDTFQTNRADKIFILSLKAAGTGLNLTAANHVIHYDLWWNPAVEAQATDRAYRIGQTKNVVVHRFITKSTFEERINEMIQNKKALADLTVSTGENWIGNLSNKELKDLFELK